MAKTLGFVKASGVVVFAAPLAAGQAWAVQMDMVGRKLEYPQWNSWAGLKGWTNTVAEAFGYSLELSELIVRSPRSDFEWALDLEPEVIRELLKFSPFRMDKSLDAKKVWYEKFRCDGITWQTFCHAIKIELFNSMAEYRYAERILDGDLSMVEGLLAIKGWQHMSPALLAEAFLPAFYVKEYEVRYQIAEGKEALVSKDFARGPRHSLQWFVTGGIKPAEVLGWCGLKLSSKEAHEFMCAILKTKATYRHSILPLYAEWKFKEVPTAWLNHISSQLKLEWAARNIRHLSKVRTVHGPAGETATIHYHQLLEHVTDEMLPSGAKTSWKKVEEALDDIAQAKILEQLGEYRLLPEFPTVPPNGIKQLKSSWDLRDEGHRMDHCVGGYINACLQGRCYIFHVDGVEDLLGATVEVVPSWDGSYYVEQSMLPHNKPSHVARAKVKEWLDHII